MNVEIGTEATQFPEKEDINGIFVAVYGDLRRISPFTWNFQMISFPFYILTLSYMAIRWRWKEYLDVQMIVLSMLNVLLQDYLTGTDGQIRSAREWWYQWIGLRKHVRRYKFSIF